MSTEPLVGRAGELERLQRLLDRAGVGECRVALLIGEPGVGKTRLAREFAARAENRGAVVLWGAAYEDWTPPYGPWTRALAPYFVQRIEELGADAAVLSAVVPALGEHAELTVAPTLGSREQQSRLHDAVARRLADAERSVVVVLDDLHWADRASLELLAAVARSGAGALVLATLRDEEPSPALAQCLSELTRERLVERLRVAPLTQNESAALLEQIVGKRPSLAAAIFERAHGNAFFTEELARHAREAGESTIPDTIRLAVAARVRHLSPETARVLGVAAVFSRPFGFRVLQTLSELPETAVLDALDEALAARLLTVADPATESYDFGHALVRESLYEELNPSRRARLHRRAATALEQLGVGTDLEAAAELATQYHRSASLPGAAHGLGHALIAADAAEARYARGEATNLLRIARDLGGELDAAARAKVLCRLALAEADGLELEHARATADEALAALREAETPNEEIAGFHWSLARTLQAAGVAEEQYRPLVEDGLALVGDEHGLPWARLELVLRPVEPLPSSRIATERWLGYDSDAVRIARASGDERDYAATLELMDWRERDEVDALLERSRRWHEPAARIHALSIVARTLLYNLGAFRESREVSRELLAESERVGSLAGVAYALELIADVEVSFGEFEAARANLGRARETAAKLGPAHRVHFVIENVEIRQALFFGGDWQAIARDYERAATDPSSPWPWITVLAAAYAAFAHARAGAAAAARRLLDEVIALLETLPPRTLNQNATVALVGWTISELGGEEHAARCRALARALIEAGVGDHVVGSNELTVARAATVLGDHDEAAQWYRRARATLEADGRRPLHAQAVVDGSAAALAAGVAPPLPELRAAHAYLDELSMPAAEQARALLERAEAKPPAGLTEREVEILRLLADGRTNREIAETLVLSVHTIERHLANAYRKIGGRNRADATAFALRNL